MSAKSKTKSRISDDAMEKGLEMNHPKLSDLREELRIISMEYVDIRSRIEASDVLIDHMVHQLDLDIRMRKWTVLLIAVLLIVTSGIALKLALGF